MSVRNTRFKVTTACEFSCTAGSSSLSGGAVKGTASAQPFFTDGVTGTQKIGFKTGTITAGSNVTVDLTALDSPDGGSGTVSLSVLVAAYIQVTSAAGSLVVGNAGSNVHRLGLFGADAHTVTLQPGATGRTGPALVYADPTATGSVVDGTHKNVLLTNPSGASVTYVAYFGGR